MIRKSGRLLAIVTILAMVMNGQAVCVLGDVIEDTSDSGNELIIIENTEDDVLTVDQEESSIVISSDEVTEAVLEEQDNDEPAVLSSNKMAVEEVKDNDEYYEDPDDSEGFHLGPPVKGEEQHDTLADGSDEGSEPPVTGRRLYTTGGESNTEISYKSYDAGFTNSGKTNRSLRSTFFGSTPSIATLLDYLKKVNVVYSDTNTGNVIIERYNSNMEKETGITIGKKGIWGGTVCDDAGNYYITWGKDGDDPSDITMIIEKYDYSGNLLASRSYKGSETASYSGDEWGTKLPFSAGNCSMAISNGVLMVNYARQMFSGHQSNMALYFKCSDMSRISGPSCYTSHSFDQRAVGVQGGFLALNQGDAFYRGFHVSKVKMGDTGSLNGDAYTFHFREGGNRAYGYNETYAQAGGLAELDNSYVLCASSERALSYDVSTQNTEYLSHFDTRDLFVQYLKKDFGSYSGAQMFQVNGETRRATGSKPADTTNLHLYLGENTVDYGVKWLTNYDSSHFAAHPKIVRLNDERVGILWEKRAIVNLYRDEEEAGSIETYYMELDSSGNTIKGATLLQNAGLAADIDPVCKDGVIYWATNDARGCRINALYSTIAHDDSVEVTGVNVSPATLGLKPGQTGTLTATVSPSNATNKGVTWSSSNTSVATVDANGKVTAVGAGSATITAKTKDGGKTAACTVTVSWLDCQWSVVGGKSYWYEKGVKQGTYSDPQGVIGDGTVRGREIYDPASNAWYWLDSVYDGAKAVGKEVWMPYIYQNEKSWGDAEIRSNANASDAGMQEQTYNAIKQGIGKWVRYDETGRMLKGWVTISGALAELYPKQKGNTYYYDHKTGLMAKGRTVIDGREYYFDEVTGALKQ